MNHIEDYLNEVAAISKNISHRHCELAITYLKWVRRTKGRVFVIGCGGSAANASHFVNDLRKLCGIEAYAPTDNVSHLTALANDNGWNEVFVRALKSCNLSDKDLLFVLSVGGGSVEKNVSVNISAAMEYASRIECPIVAIVGKSTGDSAQFAKVNIVVPEASKDRITPHAESFQSVICHLLVSSPELQLNQTTW